MVSGERTPTVMSHSNIVIFASTADIGLPSCPQVDFLKQETGIQPATFSLRRRCSTENNELGVSRRIYLMIASRDSGDRDATALMEADAQDVDSCLFSACPQLRRFFHRASSLGCVLRF